MKPQSTKATRATTTFQILWRPFGEIRSQAVHMHIISVKWNIMDSRHSHTRAKYILSGEETKGLAGVHSKQECEPQGGVNEKLVQIDFVNVNQTWESDVRCFTVCILKTRCSQSGNWFLGYNHSRSWSKIKLMVWPHSESFGKYMWPWLWSYS